MPQHALNFTDPGEIVPIWPHVVNGRPNVGPSMVFGYGWGGPAQLDPVLLKALKTVRAGIIEYVCDIGFGKSWTMKYGVLLLMSLARADGSPFRIGADDLKHYDDGGVIGDVAGMEEEIGQVEAGGEYGPLARLAGCTVIDLPNARMNILDPDLGMTIPQDKGMLLVTLQLLVDSVSLPHFWDTAVETSLVALRSLPRDLQTLDMLLQLINHDPRKPLTDTTEELAELLVSVPRETLEQISLWPAIDGVPQRIEPVSDYVRATSSLVDTLKRLKGGIFGKMFDGTNSMAKLMSQRVVVTDYSKLSDPAIAMAHSIFQQIRTSAMARHDKRFEINVQLLDEAHRFWGIAAWAKSTAHTMKIIRSFGNFMMLATQRESDIHATGSALAINSLEDVSMVVVGHLKSSEAKKLAERYNFTDEVVEWIQALQEGQFLIFIHGQPPFFMHVPPTDLTRAIAETDQASDRNIASVSKEEAVA